MSKVAIVYWSGTGNTEIMANLVSEGIISAGGEAAVFTSADFSAEKAKEFEKFAFGCPSMGVEQLEEAEFEPMFLEVKPELRGKKVGLFGSYGWGNGEWMEAWQNDCESAGCIILGDCVMANNAPDDEASQKCRDLGVALAKA